MIIHSLQFNPAKNSLRFVADFDFMFILCDLLFQRDGSQESIVMYDTFVFRIPILTHEQRSAIIECSYVVDELAKLELHLNAKSL